MPPEAPGPETPQEKLRRARSNLARAKATNIGPDVLLEDLCFDAQQACEKALKAVLVSKSRTVPRTHSIGELVSEVAVTGVAVPADVTEAAVLTDYGVRDAMRAHKEAGLPVFVYRDGKAVWISPQALGY